VLDTEQPGWMSADVRVLARRAVTCAQSPCTCSRVPVHSCWQHGSPARCLGAAAEQVPAWLSKAARHHPHARWGIQAQVQPGGGYRRQGGQSALHQTMTLQQATEGTISYHCAAVLVAADTAPDTCCMKGPPVAQQAGGTYAARVMKLRASRGAQRAPILPSEVTASLQGAQGSGTASQRLLSSFSANTGASGSRPWGRLRGVC
jgi:hypothetical protein